MILTGIGTGRVLYKMHLRRFMKAEKAWVLANAKHAHENSFQGCELVRTNARYTNKSPFQGCDWVRNRSSKLYSAGTTWVHANAKHTDKNSFQAYPL